MCPCSNSQAFALGGGGVCRSALPAVVVSVSGSVVVVVVAVGVVGRRRRRRRRRRRCRRRLWLSQAVGDRPLARVRPQDLVHKHAMAFTGGWEPTRIRV